jgi:hypothetical protein
MQRTKSGKSSHLTVISPVRNPWAKHLNKSMVISIISPKYTMTPKRMTRGGGSEGVGCVGDGME